MDGWMSRWMDVWMDRWMQLIWGVKQPCSGVTFGIYINQKYVFAKGRNGMKRLALPESYIICPFSMVLTITASTQFS